MAWQVVVGHLADGFSFHGPFEHHLDAWQWGNTQAGPNLPWQVCEILPALTCPAGLSCSGAAFPGHEAHRPVGPAGVAMRPVVGGAGGDTRYDESMGIARPPSA